MPVGVTNDNAAFQRMLENLLEPVPDCTQLFVDDVNTSSEDPSMSYDELQEAHERDITRMLDLLVRHKLTCSGDKATGAARKLVFAGTHSLQWAAEAHTWKGRRLSSGRSPRQCQNCGHTWGSAGTTQDISRCMPIMQPP